MLAGGAAVARESQTITRLFLAQTFINEQLKAHMRSQLMRDLKIDLDPKAGRIYLRGVLQVPVEEMRAINLDPKLGAFRFQLTIRPEATGKGYLVLEFPLDETFFYPVSSKNPSRDRILVPVQLLSLGLASARGYLAALSGDFSGFERRAAKYKALIKALDRSIAAEKNPDALETMRTERDSLRLQQEALPIERRQVKVLAKEVESLLGFAGEQELNLNNELAARSNALIIKLNVAQFAPFLKGVELGGVRVEHDDKDGAHGENYFVVDINSLNATMSPPRNQGIDDGNGLKVAPAAMLRINQELFESELIVSAEKKAMGSQLKDLKIELKEDGMHVSGKYHRFFFNVPFDTIVDLDISDTDAFDVSVRDIKIAGLDLEFLTGFVLESMQRRLDQTLKGICTFQYIGEKKDHSRVLRVTVNPKRLMPALASFHLVDVEVRDREFLMKVGKDD